MWPNYKLASLKGEIGVDEAYFGGRRKGKRGRGATGKSIYRGVSKYHFPMYLKEVEYRFNHLKDNLFKLFLKIYFGCVSN